MRTAVAAVGREVRRRDLCWWIAVCCSLCCRIVLLTAEAASFVSCCRIVPRSASVAKMLWYQKVRLSVEVDCSVLFQTSRPFVAAGCLW